MSTVTLRKKANLQPKRFFLGLAFVSYLLSACAPSARPSSAEVAAPTLATHRVERYGVDYDYYLDLSTAASDSRVLLVASGEHPNLSYAGGSALLTTRVECFELPDPYAYRDELFYTASCKLGDLQAGTVNLIISGDNLTVAPYFTVDSTLRTLPTIFADDIED